MTKKLLQAIVIDSEAIGLYNKKNLVAINPKDRKLCRKELIPYRKLCRSFKIKFNVDVRLVLN